MHTYIRVYIHTYTHAYTHTHTYVCMYVYTYTHTYKGMRQQETSCCGDVAGSRHELLKRRIQYYTIYHVRRGAASSFFGVYFWV